MDLILDIICQMSIWETLGFGLICVYILMALPGIGGWLSDRYREYKRMDREEYQPWMDKEKWNATR